ncbi:MBL fold metallo-hydrolase [Crenobacter intestini]|uniref:MBL fold metallo-hydrolase n=1 Tax=Crenobacter intestini TaxID=2563443 RepID=A0A4T0UNI6_9NEIS|nr:MBL fold metallo-hydrolase [Crenobacter intestini]TIC80300.1 MBL fold metallo-hydrolase [Crenobacter intestini]
MKVRIHRGCQQIGGTCVELQYQDCRIVLDFGLPLDGDAADGALLPALVEGPLAAVLVSHPHLDHYGLLHHLPADTPVAMGAAARRIIEAAAPFTGQPLPPLAGPTLAHRQALQIGPFRVTPYLVDHSAYDAYAFLVEAGGKRLFYSGDFRAHGRKSGLFEAMLSQPPQDIDVLLMEGSSLSRPEGQEGFPTETDLENELASLCREAPGLVMVHASAQNIDRIVSLYRACKRSGRTLVIDLYTAAVLAATGNANIPQSFWPQVALYTPERQRKQIVRLQAFELLQKHSARRIYPEQLKAIAANAVLLFRPMHMQDLDAADCLQDASFVFSQWAGYLQQDGYRAMQDWLAARGIGIRHLHTSGHASTADLRRFAAALNPRQLVPIHSFAPDEYPKQFANVVPRQDGEWWTVAA